jgi:SAM-dependent methyltransferase
MAAEDSTVADRLVEAINADTLATVVRELRAGAPAAETDRLLLDGAAEALAAIGRDGTRVWRTLAEGLARADIQHRAAGPVVDELGSPEPALQRIAVDVHVEEDMAAAAVAVARTLGYRPWYRVERGGWTAYRHLYPDLHLVGETPNRHPVVVRFVWREATAGIPARAPRLRKVLDRLRPPPRELEALVLPAPLWFGYFVLRPFRLAAHLVGRRRAPLDLGPYLPTPSPLIDALLDTAAAEPPQVVADLGCGDGRVLVQAARRGLRAVGVEHDPGLAEQARSAARAAGVADRIDVVSGEASDLDLGEVDVVLLFVPATSLPTVVGDLRRRMAPGSRIVAHEQARVAMTADDRRPVVMPGGVTVIYRWDV